MTWPTFGQQAIVLTTIIPITPNHVSNDFILKAHQLWFQLCELTWVHPSLNCRLAFLSTTLLKKYYNIETSYCITQEIHYVTLLWCKTLPPSTATSWPLMVIALHLNYEDRIHWGCIRVFWVWFKGQIMNGYKSVWEGKGCEAVVSWICSLQDTKNIYFFDSKFENILKIILIQPLFFVLYNKILLELYMDVQYNMEVQLNWFNWFANWLIKQLVCYSLFSVQCLKVMSESVDDDVRVLRSVFWSSVLLRCFS